MGLMIYSLGLFFVDKVCHDILSGSVSVITYDSSDHVVGNNKYTISSGIIDFQANNYIAAAPKSVNQDVFPIFNFDKTFHNLTSTPIFDGRLCVLNNVYPRIAGQSAIYTFSFNFNNYPNNIKNSTHIPNEISIYFDINNYEINNDILCKFNNIIIV